MDVTRILFITGPPGSGKTTLAQGVRLLLHRQATVIGTSALCIGNRGSWRDLGAMYHDEFQLAADIAIAIARTETKYLIIDGAPREPGQFGWAKRARVPCAVVALRNFSRPETSVEYARHARWFGVQLHEVARHLVWTEHLLGPESGYLEPGAVADWLAAL